MEIEEPFWLRNHVLFRENYTEHQSRSRCLQGASSHGVRADQSLFWDLDSRPTLKAKPPKIWEQFAISSQGIQGGVGTVPGLGFSNSLAPVYLFHIYIYIYSYISIYKWLILGILYKTLI